jgi:hypothetical protein
MSKLNLVVHKDIYERRKNGETLQSIADSYGVTKENIRQKIVRYKRYLKQIPIGISNDKLVTADFNELKNLAISGLVYHKKNLTFRTLSHGVARTLFSVHTPKGRYDFCISYGWYLWRGFRVPDFSFFICHNPDDTGSIIPSLMIVLWIFAALVLLFIHKKK